MIFARYMSVHKQGVAGRIRSSSSLLDDTLKPLPIPHIW